LLFIGLDVNVGNYGWKNEVSKKLGKKEINEGERDSKRRERKRGERDMRERGSGLAGLLRIGLGSRIARFGFGSDHSNPDRV
jgi:hypothetical protein